MTPERGFLLDPERHLRHLDRGARRPVPCGGGTGLAAARRALHGVLGERRRLEVRVWRGTAPGASTPRRRFLTVVPGMLGAGAVATAAPVHVGGARSPECQTSCIVADCTCR